MYATAKLYFNRFSRHKNILRKFLPLTILLLFVLSPGLGWFHIFKVYARLAGNILHYEIGHNLFVVHLKEVISCRVSNQIPILISFTVYSCSRFSHQCCWFIKSTAVQKINQTMIWIGLNQSVTPSQVKSNKCHTNSWNLKGSLTKFYRLIIHNFGYCFTLVPFWYKYFCAKSELFWSYLNLTFYRHWEGVTQELTIKKEECENGFCTVSQNFFKKRHEVIFDDVFAFFLA